MGLLRSLVTGWLIRPRTVQYTKNFFEALSEVYRLGPYYEGHPTDYHGLRISVFGYRLYDYETGNEVGHFSCWVTETHLHITSIGRTNRTDLLQKDGTMTHICKTYIEGLCDNGLKDVSLMDCSGGYWNHFFKKYFPSLKWINTTSDCMP